ncbi:MAG: O-methyltransferase [Solirubrobacterales bacterium]
MNLAPKAQAARAVRAMLGHPNYERASMVAKLPGVARRRDPTSRALARTLATAALRRLPASERDWVSRVEGRRRELAADGTAVAPSFDAGSGAVPGGLLQSGEPIPIGGIAEAFSIPMRWGMFLIRLVRELAPVTSLELGTGLGISSAYQAAGLELNGRGELTTLEGARAWAEVAEQGLSSLGLAERCRVEVGPIDETLEPVLNRIAPIDYAYLDADHSEEATVKHFEAVLPHMAPGGVVVLDDVAFSWDMWQAWTRITSADRVTVRVALDRMGVLVVD